MMLNITAKLQVAYVMASLVALTTSDGSAAAGGAPMGKPASSSAFALSDTQDALFERPYIDVDEWRDAPVRHRYVHGGFRGTETRFSFYLPPKDLYEGRFFQHITPSPDNEYLA